VVLRYVVANWQRARGSPVLRGRPDADARTPAADARVVVGDRIPGDQVAVARRDCDALRVGNRAAAVPGESYEVVLDEVPIGEKCRRVLVGVSEIPW
jgi:hypothetical protein